MALQIGDTILGRTSDRDVYGVVRQVWEAWALVLLPERLPWEAELLDINAATHLHRPELDCGWLTVGEQPGWTKLDELLSAGWDSTQPPPIQPDLRSRLWLIPISKERTSGSLNKGEFRIKK